MRKLAVAVLGLACVGMLSMGAMATDSTPNDGQAVTTGALVFVDGSPTGVANELYGARVAPSFPTDPGDQSAKVTLKANALLDCYLQLDFKGNGANAKLQSFGPNAAVTWDGAMAQGTASIDFLPTISGYVDGSWNKIAGFAFSQNAEVEPGPNVFIPSCDIFRSELWSNLDYKFSVKSTGLNLHYADKDWNLAVDMRANVQDGQATSAGTMNKTATFGNNTIPAASTAQVSEYQLIDGKKADGTLHNVLNYMTVYTQFKVPYDKLHPAGNYTGEMVWEAATI